MTTSRTDRTRHVSPAELALRLARGAAVAGVCVCATTMASADITIAEWDDQYHFSYRVRYMPDLDQKRQFLPGDGSMYCVPTATMNLFAYAAEWGFPETDPGEGDWADPSNYLEMTVNLANLGGLMGTTAEGGTGGSGWYDGAIDWRDDAPLLVARWYRTADWYPKTTDMALMGSTGAIIAPCYGRYEYENGFMGQIFVGERTGGHCVTLVRAVSDGFFTEEVSVHDPSNGSSLLSQSDYVMKTYDSVETMDILFDLDEDGFFDYIAATALNHPIGDGRIRLFDSYMMMRPMFGMSFTTVELNFENLVGGFGFVSPNFPDFTPASVGFQQIIECELHPELHSVLALVRRPDGGASLLRRTLFGEDVEEFVDVPGDALGLAIGRHRELFVLTGRSCEKRSLDAPGDVVDVFEFPYDLDHLAYDDTTDCLWIVAEGRRKLICLPRSFGSEVEPVLEWDLPTAPFGPVFDLCPDEQGGVWIGMAADEDGEYWFLDVQPAAASGELEVVESILSDLVESPRGLHCDDLGHLLLSGDGSVIPFGPDEFGRWVPLMIPMYADLELPDRAAYLPARSRTNFEPGVHDTEAWNNIPAEELVALGAETPVCPLDLNGDGVIDAADLSIVLGAWGTSDPLGDANGDGIVDAVDLSSILGGWGPCR